MAIKTPRHYKESGTHIPTLLKVIPLTTGDVCEVGAGFNSTPLLHWLCQGRNLVTYENDQEWFRFAKQFQTYTHKIYSFNEIDFDRHWSVVFIDSVIDGERTQRQRGEDVLKFKNVDIFILHDTEPIDLGHYHYDRVFLKFKYRKDWTECLPHTSIISNIIDVSKW